MRFDPIYESPDIRLEIELTRRLDRFLPFLYLFIVLSHQLLFLIPRSVTKFQSAFSLQRRIIFREGKEISTINYIACMNLEVSKVFSYEKENIIQLKISM